MGGVEERKAQLSIPFLLSPKEPIQQMSVYQRRDEIRRVWRPIQLVLIPLAHPTTPFGETSSFTNHIMQNLKFTKPFPRYPSFVLVSDLLFISHLKQL